MNAPTKKRHKENKMKAVCTKCGKDCVMVETKRFPNSSHSDCIGVSNCCKATLRYEAETQENFNPNTEPQSCECYIDDDIGEPLSFEPYQEPFNEEKFAAEIAFEAMKNTMTRVDGYFTSSIGKNAYGIVDNMLEEHRKRFPKKEKKNDIN